MQIPLDLLNGHAKLGINEYTRILSPKKKKKKKMLGSVNGKTLSIQS